MTPPAAHAPEPSQPIELTDEIPAAERAFYVDEFTGATIVVSLGELGTRAVASTARATGALAAGASRFVLVVGGGVDELVAALLRTLPAEPVVLDAPGTMPDDGWLAELWLAITDRSEVVVRVEPGAEATVAAELAVALRARKLVITDPSGGWGRPPRSFADVSTHATAFQAQLAERQGGRVVAALTGALEGRVSNVNLCRAEDLDRELFTFDGAGTLFTSGGYVELGPLRVDDLSAVERLVAQGTADGLLRPRSRLEVARLAVTGLGARVVGSGHLAGIVSLEADRYREEQVGEVACLYTVSRFSGAGAGALLVDGLVDRAREAGLGAVFAVTVSDAAAAFFVRKGFREVGRHEVPAQKWDGYDAERLAQARAFVRDVGSGAEQPLPGF